MKNYVPMKALFLGFKRVGRGTNSDLCKLTKDEISSLVSASDWSYCIDTAFINTYSDWYKDWYGGDEELFLTRNEGEFSMYIDAVTATAYKSSYDTTEGFDVLEGYDSNSYTESNNIEKTFAKIRKSCGFDVYEPRRKYYE
jgi:hypothetical protein